MVLCAFVVAVRLVHRHRQAGEAEEMGKKPVLILQALLLTSSAHNPPAAA
jgi:hypothetical protein